MKKLLTILLLLCVMAGALMISAAAEGSSAAVLRVAGMLEDGKLVSPKTYTNFEEGWNAAAELALNDEWLAANQVRRIVVDLYAKWNADDDGEFGSGTGFSGDAIHVPSDASMTINMNGHTIDRKLTTDRKNGEVINLGSGANLIVNGGQQGDPIVEAGKDPGTIPMGTIRGGNSYNGAGGIHMNSKSVLTLNNVHLTGNRVEDDDGSAIAAYSNSTVIINGGSVSNNVMHLSHSYYLTVPYGTIYLSDSKAVLNNVEFADNVGTGLHWADGLLVYLNDSKATLTDCLFRNNAYLVTEIDAEIPSNMFSISDAASSLEITRCRFENNGDEAHDITATPGRSYDIFDIEGGTLTVTDSYFEGNKLNHIVHANKGTFEIKNCHFINNRARLYYNRVEEGSHFTNCTFSGNHLKGVSGVYCKYAYVSEEIDFIDCNFLDNPLVDEKYKKSNIIDSSAPNGATASIFGEGSLTVILAILAFGSSIVSIVMTVAYNKKNALPVPAKAAKTQEESEE